MTQQLRWDVNEADEAEQRRLERHPESGHAGAVLAAARFAWGKDMEELERTHMPQLLLDASHSVRVIVVQVGVHVIALLPWLVRFLGLA